MKFAKKPPALLLPLYLDQKLLYRGLVIFYAVLCFFFGLPASPSLVHSKTKKFDFFSEYNTSQMFVILESGFFIAFTRVALDDD